MNLRIQTLVADLQRKIDVLLRETHGDLCVHLRKEAAEQLRELSRDAATSAAGAESVDADYPGGYARYDRDRARVYRAIADVLDPRETEEVAETRFKLSLLYKSLEQYEIDVRAMHVAAQDGDVRHAEKIMTRALHDIRQLRARTSDVTGSVAQKTEFLMLGLRGAAASLFHGIDPAYRQGAEKAAREIVERANASGLPVVAGTLIAAADMLERVVRMMRE